MVGTYLQVTVEQAEGRVSGGGSFQGEGTKLRRSSRLVQSVLR